MLTKAEKAEIETVAVSSLDRAECIWNQVGDQMVLAAKPRAFVTELTEYKDTQIPGYPTVEFGKPMVDDFIAIVADMRGSTTHLLQALSQKNSRVSQLQRVFYETSALLPSLAKAIAYQNGNVTEYLGDGVLGLFCMDAEEHSRTIHKANRAAENCLETVNSVVNVLLHDRYHLPPLNIGVGLAFSKAVVTIVGLPDFTQPKVFGECVFRATKLASGTNEVMIDKALKCIWPKAQNGTLRFLPKKVRGNVQGYVVHRNDK